MNDLTKRAESFAIQAHRRIDHRRKYTLQPYDAHLKAVADLVESVTDDPEVIAAAWLHDAVEDTPATFQDIEHEFGREVRRLVVELTDVSRPGDGNRAARKALDREHTAQASPRAKTVKLADLIDNCQDICRHDPRFGRLYLTEMMDLLPVLKEGDATLYARAETTVEKCAEQLGLQGTDPAVYRTPDAHPEPVLAHTRALRLFTEAFSARDVAEPLLSFDASTPAEAVRRSVEEGDLQVVGVRRAGQTDGYLRLQELGDGSCTDAMRAIVPAQILNDDAALSDVVHVLTRFEYCFVALLGGVSAVITRADIQKPIVRMWLFGIITVIEMNLVDIIRNNWPGHRWTGLLQERRLEKALSLQRERARRNQQCDLLDCLQLSDKAQVVMQEPRYLEELGFRSRREAKRIVRELESLRNNLAHAQDIVTHDWPQIARMTQRMENILGHI